MDLCHKRSMSSERLLDPSVQLLRSRTTNQEIMWNVGGFVSCRTLQRVCTYHLLAVRRNSDTPTPICKCHAMCKVMRLIREWHHRFPRTPIASAKPLAQFVSANMKLSLFSLVLGGLNRALRLTKAYNSSSSMGNTDRQLYYTCNKNKMSKSLLRKSCGLEKWWH